MAVDASGVALARVYQGKIVLHAPRCPAYAVVKDWCGMSGAGPAHDGIFIFPNGKEPFQFAVKARAQPPAYSTLPAGEKPGAADQRGSLKFYPYVQENEIHDPPSRQF